MHLKGWLAFSLIMLIPGCSTQKNDPVNVDSGASNVEAPVIGPSEEHLPVKIHIETAGEHAAGERVLVVKIEPEREFAGFAVMKVEPEAGTQTNFDGGDEPLPELMKGQAAVRNLELRGEHPAVNVKVVINGDGFAMSVSATWPEKQTPQQHDGMIRGELPAPIEINGVMVDRGVEVGQ